MALHSGLTVALMSAVECGTALGISSEWVSSCSMHKSVIHRVQMAVQMAVESGVPLESLRQQIWRILRLETEPPLVCRAVAIGVSVKCQSAE